QGMTTAAIRTTNSGDRTTTRWSYTVRHFVFRRSTTFITILWKQALWKARSITFTAVPGIITRARNAACWTWCSYKHGLPCEIFDGFFEASPETQSQDNNSKDVIFLTGLRSH